VQDYVVFDLETTGISCISDEVVEISAVKVLKGEVTEEFSTLVNPGRPIPFRATEVNGITNEMVKDAPDFESALKDFLDFIGDMILVGHNIHSFDMKFICRDAQKYFGQTIGNDYIDTLPLARRYLPGLGHYTLSDLADHYGIEKDGAHRALFDCHMNREIYEHLGEEIRHPSEEAQQVRICPVCGNGMKLRTGRYGEFWGCMSFPNCRHTEKKLP
jgi:DNA polymerase III epsilon subunit family exonuclease